MKVLFDHQIFLLQKYGGISRYIVRLNEHLNNFGVNSKIYSPISINSHIGFNNNIEINHFKFKKIYKYCTKLFNYYNGSFTNFYINDFKPDIIHQTYYKKNYKLKKKKPIILTVYDLIHEKFYEKYNLKANNNWKLNSIKEADHIICISQNTQKDLLNYYNVSKDKTSVIYLASDIKSDLKKNNKKIKANEKFILYVGNRKRYKNFYNFVKAFSNSKILKKEYKIICCGSSNFDYEEIIFFKKNNLDLDKINFVQGDDHQLLYLYENASSLVFPSKYEGFGLPAIEAMSLGCPVIASRINIFEEILGNNAAFFNPNDIEDIQKTMEDILLSKDKLNELSTLGLKHSKKFNWQYCAKETLNIYKKLY